jgi:hypothetical protein
MSGCATEDIVVSEVAMTDRPDASVVGWAADESGRQVFSPEDEAVTIKVLFDFNYRGVFEWYKVEWIAPGGVDYRVVLRRTDFASHRNLQASLKIRGKMASRLPGLWRVRISLRGREGAPDRELVSRLFRIAEPTAKMIAAGLTAVDPPDAIAGRPLDSHSQAASAMPAKVAIDVMSAPPSAPPPPGKASAPVALSGVPGPATEQASAVLVPLGIAGSGTVAPLAPVAAPNTEAPPSPDEAGVAAVSLHSTPADPEQRLVPPRKREYVGCPPLYYRAGPGCVEQAPEE